MIRPLLLHLANSGYQTYRQDFYAFKRKLLERHAVRGGYDVQEIVKPCWGWNWDGCTKERRCKCGGSGTYYRRRFTLLRWRWGRFFFHTPTDAIPPANSPATITGYVKHRNYGRLSKEAALWLYLLSGELRLFWREFNGSTSLGWYGWPLVNLQRVVNPIRRKLRRERCIHCRKKFFAWGSGWCVCRKCRVLPFEVPF